MPPQANNAASTRPTFATHSVAIRFFILPLDLPASASDPDWGGRHHGRRHQCQCRYSIRCLAFGRSPTRVQTVYDVLVSLFSYLAFRRTCRRHSDTHRNRIRSAYDNHCPRSLRGRRTPRHLKSSAADTDCCPANTKYHRSREPCQADSRTAMADNYRRCCAGYHQHKARSHRRRYRRLAAAPDTYRQQMPSHSHRRFGTRPRDKIDLRRRSQGRASGHRTSDTYRQQMATGNHRRSGTRLRDKIHLRRNSSGHAPAHKSDLSELGYSATRWRHMIANRVSAKN